MQSTYISWVPAVSPPPLSLSNSKPRLSTASPNQPQTQKISQYRYYNSDGDIDNPAEVKFTLPAHVKSITSTLNPFVKHCVKLRKTSSYRHFHGSAIVVGTTPIRYFRILSEIFAYSLPELQHGFFSFNEKKKTLLLAIEGRSVNALLFFQIV